MSSPTTRWGIKSRNPNGGIGVVSGYKAQRARNKKPETKTLSHFNLLTTLIVFFAVLLQGCTSTATSQEPVDFEVEFSTGAQQYATAEGEAVDIVRRGADQLAVSGTMRLPNPCFELNASGLAYPDSLLLIIEATPLPQMCTMAETMLPYELVVQRTADEWQEVHVRHAFTGAENQARTFQLKTP